MSYSLVRRPFSLSSLGIAISTPTVELPSCDVKTGSAAADAAFKKCCEEAKKRVSFRSVTSTQALSQIKDCSAKAVSDAAQEKACSAVKTGIYYVDQGFTTCCQAAWKSTGSVGERAKKIAVCTANATASAALTGTLAAGATALCAAGGVATAGITTALAATGVCGFVGGTVGVFLYNRIGGYQTQSLVLGLWAGAVCGAISGGTLAIVCGFAVAELVEWISDAVGPLLEDIFNPDAAAWRKRAELRAMRAARDAVESSLHDAESQITEQWQATVNRIWDLYETLFPFATDRAAAFAATGVTNAYESIARALLAASKRFPIKAEIDQYGGYDAALAAISRGNGAGIQYTLLDGSEVARRTANHQASCEIYGRATNGNFGPPSQLCPPLLYRGFWEQEDAPISASAKASSTVATVTAVTQKRTADYYKKLGASYGVTITDFFALLPMAETYVANTITTFATVRRLSDLQISAEQAVKTKNDAKLMATATSAAKSAEEAAEQAKSWSGDTRSRALVAVQHKYDVAKHARALMTYAATPGAASSATYQRRANEAVARAASAVKSAQSNARTAQVMIGATAAVGVAGIGYLLLRRT